MAIQKAPFLPLISLGPGPQHSRQSRESIPVPNGLCSELPFNSAQQALIGLAALGMGWAPHTLPMDLCLESGCSKTVERWQVLEKGPWCSAFLAESVGGNQNTGTRWSIADIRLQTKAWTILLRSQCHSFTQFKEGTNETYKDFSEVLSPIFSKAMSRKWLQCLCLLFLPIILLPSLFIKGLA